MNAERDRPRRKRAHRLLSTGRHPDPAGRQGPSAEAGRRGCQLPPGHRDPTPPPSPGGGAGTPDSLKYRPDPLTAPRLPDPVGERVPPLCPEPSTAQVAQRYPELGDLIGWEWSYLSTVDLLVGMCAVRAGVCTLYIDAWESATVWTPTAHGTPLSEHGTLPDIVPRARAWG